MNVISHIVEPDRLLLTWQGQEGSSRARRVVGELRRNADGVSFHYLRATPDFEAAQNEGFQGFPAFKVDDRIHVSDVLEAFLRRLPPRTRSDFGEYLRQQRIDPFTEISDFALLGYTAARLPGDSFALVHTFDEASGPFEFVTEVAGFRYASSLGVEAVHVGTPVTFQPEPSNRVDPKAIRVMYGPEVLGYVNRCQTGMFARHLAERSISAVVDRVNGRPDRASIYLFVKVDSAAGLPVTRRVA